MLSFGQDCKAAFAGTNAKIGSAAPFDITFNTNVVEGYTSKFCVKCGNGVQDITEVYEMSQKGRCIARMSKISDDDSKPIILSYKETSELSVVSNAFSDYFVNDPVDGNCPVTKCEIKAKGCVDKFTKTTTSLTKKTSTQGISFDIMSPLNRPYGFVDEICVICSNGDETYKRQTI